MSTANLFGFPNREIGAEAMFAGAAPLLVNQQLCQFLVNMDTAEIVAVRQEESRPVPVSDEEANSRAAAACCCCAAIISCLYYVYGGKYSDQAPFVGAGMLRGAVMTRDVAQICKEEAYLENNFTIVNNRQLRLLDKISQIDRVLPFVNDLQIQEQLDRARDYFQISLKGSVRAQARLFNYQTQWQR